MSTIAKNRVVRSIAVNAVFEDCSNLVTSSTNWNQGDQLVYDTSAGVVRVIATESSDSANFLGIAVVTVVNGAIQGAYGTLATGSQVASGGIPGPQYGVEALWYLKSGDTLIPGQKVYAYPSGSVQTVSASGTNAIGVYNGPAITGTSTSQINVRVGCTYLKGALCW